MMDQQASLIRRLCEAKNPRDLNDWEGRCSQRRCPQRRLPRINALAAMRRVRVEAERSTRNAAVDHRSTID